MSDSTARDAHSQSNSQTASECKSCLCPADQNCCSSTTERLNRLECIVRRMACGVRVISVLLFLMIILFAYKLGQGSQARNPMQWSMGAPQHGGPMGPTHNGMPMRNGMPMHNGMMDHSGNGGEFEVFIERFEDDADNDREGNDRGDDDKGGDRNKDKVRKRMTVEQGNKWDGVKPPKPPEPPKSAQ